MSRNLWFSLFIISILTVQLARSEESLLRDNDRIAFVGNTFVERAQRYGHIETAILMASEAKNLVFRNLGWSGDSVFNDSRSYFGPPKEGRDRLGKAIAEMQPTVVFVCYGTGEAMSINQGWTSEKIASAYGPGAGIGSDLSVFLAGYKQLIENIRQAGGSRLREIVLVTPPPLENLGPPLPSQAENNRNLGIFAKAIVNLAHQENYKTVDLYNSIGPSTKVANPPFTDNGVHYGDAGYRMIAWHFVKAINLPYTTTNNRNSAAAEELRDTVLEKNRLFFHRWRPANETYLFLFRKHEQGNNAKEIPMFDPLIKKQEAKIETLRRQIRNLSKPA